MPSITFDQTCDTVTCQSQATGKGNVTVVQTCDPVDFVSSGKVAQVARVNNATANAVMTAVASLGAPPYLPAQHAKIYNLTGEIRGTGGALLCFIGPPHHSVEWRILKGAGMLTPFTSYTNDIGQATCRFDAMGFFGPVEVGVAWIP